MSAPRPSLGFAPSFANVKSAAEFLTMNKADVAKMLAKLAYGTYYPYIGKDKQEKKSYDFPADYEPCFDKEPPNVTNKPWFDEYLSEADRTLCGDAPPGFRFAGHVQGDHKWFPRWDPRSWNTIIAENSDADIYHSTYGKDDVCLVSIRGTDAKMEIWGQRNDLKSDISFLSLNVKCDESSPHCNNLALPYQEQCVGGVYKLQSKRRNDKRMTCGVISDEGHLKCGDNPEIMPYVEGNGGRKSKGFGEGVAGQELLIRKYGDKYTLTSRGGNIRGKYCADEGNGIMCNRDAIDDWEMFDIEPINNGEYFALKGGNADKYCADENDGRLICNRDRVGGEWEKFTLTCADPVKRKIAKGLALYYQALREKVLKACEGMTIVATGHSLGAAAAQVMHAYGDSALTLAFAPVKVFRSDGCAPEVFNKLNPKNKQMKNMFTFHAVRAVQAKNILNKVTYMRRYDIVPSIFDTANRNSQCGEQNYELRQNIPCTSGEYKRTWEDIGFIGDKGKSCTEIPPQGDQTFSLREKDNITPGSALWKAAVFGGSVWKNLIDLHMMYISYIPFFYALKESETVKLEWDVYKDEFNMGDHIKKGELWKPEQYLQSPNGKYTADIANDLLRVRDVTNRMNGDLLWSSEPQHHSPVVNGQFELRFQSDGNLVLYTSNGGDGEKDIWATSSYPKCCDGRGDVIRLQNDGNLVLYNDGKPAWSYK